MWVCPPPGNPEYVKQYKLMPKQIKHILLAFFVVLAFSAGAQQTRTVVATGDAYGKDVDVTRADALQKAKQNALLEAGVKETISSMASIIFSGEGTDMKHVQNELAIIELDGRMTMKSEPEYTTEVVGDLLHVTAKIYAAVLVEDETVDPAFGLKVEGMRSVYRDGERMEFTITPYGNDSYIRIFWFDGTPGMQQEGALMYPDAGGRYKDAVFVEGKEYLFPKLPETHSNGRPTRVTMRKESGTAVENCVVWVVALKNKVPYDVPCTYSEFLKWLHSIPAAERVVRYQPVTIIGN